MRVLLLLTGLLLGAPAGAETIVASRTLPARTVITESDIAIAADTTPGAATNISEVIGKEARATIYSGHPLFLSALAAPALVERNQLTTLIYELGALTISAEGRVLERGAVGDLVRVMNLSSRTIVQGAVQPDASISVSGSN
ncbi:flagellar basal body P-ring formation protein FlgA [Donghicola sp. C2-DW-16]|uniref:Flagella basal body P-ring formation protein FlgA n=1 Tax=Donghicola mangrovi TaxID=2729614 RepID=A0ABX2P9D6_9RHOB|nr:flagellar basal body P-ring formation chaperone FlgA [Donghicola mangrovi]NVO25968.1 flagellar basal body P-ring formation protein FlgA [Donghicola mangrovi]